MTEKEKKQAGLLYFADDPELLKERLWAKELCFQFNNLPPSQVSKKEAVLRKLLGTAPETFEILAPFSCDYGYNIHLGEHSFLNYNAIILDCAPVYIGSHVFIGPNLALYTVNHPMNAKERNTGREFARPIRIEDDVWIGGNVVILPGVTIARGSVIGAGSVVNRDIPSGVLAAGNPCRIIKAILD